MILVSVVESLGLWFSETLVPVAFLTDYFSSFVSIFLKCHVRKEVFYNFYLVHYILLCHILMYELFS